MADLDQYLVGSFVRGSRLGECFEQALACLFELLLQLTDQWCELEVGCGRIEIGLGLQVDGGCGSGRAQLFQFFAAACNLVALTGSGKRALKLKDTCTDLCGKPS